MNYNVPKEIMEQFNKPRPLNCDKRGRPQDILALLPRLVKIELELAGANNEVN
jgi:hypothetical protein